ncbi:MAG: GreA/GreB family elongation factor [Hyphomicrobiales bacterium]
MRARRHRLVPLRGCARRCHYGHGAAGKTDPERGTISRLSPIGDALAGTGVGDDVEVFLADGARTIVIDDIVKRTGARSSDETSSA